MSQNNNDNPIVWSDEHGDMRKKKTAAKDAEVVESDLILELRRLTTGKGRPVVEITALPQNKNWCKKLAKDLKKNIGVGGAYKENKIEIHGEKIDATIKFLEDRSIKWKKIGG